MLACTDTAEDFISFFCLYPVSIILFQLFNVLCTLLSTLSSYLKAEHLPVIYTVLLQHPLCCASLNINTHSHRKKLIHSKIYTCIIQFYTLGVSIFSYTEPNFMDTETSKIVFIWIIIPKKIQWIHILKNNLNIERSLTFFKTFYEPK